MSVARNLDVQLTTWARLGKGTNRIHLVGSDEKTVCGLPIRHDAAIWDSDDGAWSNGFLHMAERLSFSGPCLQCRRLR